MFIDDAFLCETEELFSDTSLNEALEDLSQMSNLCFDYQNYLAENNIIFVQLEGKAYLNEDHVMLSELNVALANKIRNGIKLFLNKFKGFIPSICNSIRNAARKIGKAIRGKFQSFVAWLKKAKVVKSGKKVAESFDDLYYDGFLFSEAPDKKILYTKSLWDKAKSTGRNILDKDVVTIDGDGEYYSVAKEYEGLFKCLREAAPDKMKADNINALEATLAELKKQMEASEKTLDTKRVIEETVKNIDTIITDTNKAESEVTKAIERASATADKAGSGDEKEGGGFFSTISKYIGKVFGFIKGIFMKIVNTIRNAFRAVVDFFKGEKKPHEPSPEVQEKIKNAPVAEVGKGQNVGDMLEDAEKEKAES